MRSKAHTIVLLLTILIAVCVPAATQDRFLIASPRIFIAEIRASNPAQAKVVSDTLVFWLKRSGSVKLAMARNAADIVLTGRVTPNADAPNQVCLTINAGSLSEERAGEAADLGFMTRQVANTIHHRVTGKWLRGIGNNEKLTAQDTLILLASDPLQQVAPSAEQNTEKINLSLTVDRGADSTYHFGETVKIHFRVDRDCLVSIFNTDNQGVTTLLFPNRYSPNNQVRANRDYELPGNNEPWEIAVEGTEGMETVTLIATKTDWDFPGKEEAGKGISVVSRGLDSFAKSLRVKLKDKGFSKATVTFYSAKK